MFTPSIYRLPGYEGSDGQFYTGFEAFYGADSWFNVSVGAILIIIFIILIVVLLVLKLFLKNPTRFYVNVLIAIISLAAFIFFACSTTSLMLATTTLAEKQYLNSYYLAFGPYLSMFVFFVNIVMTAIDELMYRKSTQDQTKQNLK